MNDSKIAQISRLFLQNTSGMVKEQDISNLFNNNQDYQNSLKIIVQNFRNIGFSLVRTSFNQERYFVLTAPGKDEKISPLMYGILGILIGLNNDLGKPISVSDAKKIFNDSWNELQMLIELNYIAYSGKKGEESIILTPIGKAATQKIAKDLSIRKLIDFSN